MDSDPIEIEPLLAPLAEGEQGAGSDLRGDFSATSPYQSLRDARSSARAEERARDASGDTEGPEAAGWRDVLAVGQKALATLSKDIEIAAWMTEALVRMHGLPGATAGAKLIAGLCEHFWEGGFPQPDEEGLEGRASPIGGLSGGSGTDGTIMQPLRRLPMFRRADGSGASLYQWEQAEQATTLDAERQQARYAAGTPELPTLEAEARLDRAYLMETGRQTAAAIAAWRELDRVLGERFGADPPSLRNVLTLLDRMAEIVTRLGGGATEEAAEADPVTQASVPGDSVRDSTTPAAGGALTREGALRELDRIAEYFRRTEPHSPLAYTLEEAVRRGRMSLSELLAEVLPDADVRNGMLQRLGMRPESQ